MMTESRLESARKELSMIRLTMAGRFCGTREWVKLGRPITKGELNLLPEIPWGDEILTSPCLFFPEKAVSQTHLLFLSVPESIRSLTGYLPRQFTRSDIEAWHMKEEEKFSAINSSFSWHLVPIAPILSFAGRSYEEQLALLPEGYRVMSAVDATIEHLLYRTSFGKPLLESGHWRNCRDVTSDGKVVKVCETERGVSYGRYPEYPRPTTTLAIERMP
jgi:hypothetical protein